MISSTSHASNLLAFVGGGAGDASAGLLEPGAFRVGFPSGTLGPHVSFIAELISAQTWYPLSPWSSALGSYVMSTLPRPVDASFVARSDDEPGMMLYAQVVMSLLCSPGMD